MTLTGARALVTGASSGIGAAVAEALAGHGARLLLCGTDAARVLAVARRTGGRALVADLTDPDDLARVCAACAEVDLLVHSAGRGWAGAITAMPAELIAGLTALNLVAPARLTGAALPGMRARGRGHLVFVASVAAVGVAEEAVYAATKSGLRTFAASVRYEVADEPIGVTTVLPGAVATPFFDRRGRPYDRRFPRPVPAGLVARRTVAAVRGGRSEVFVPRWLSVPARISGALPGTFWRLAHRFG